MTRRSFVLDFRERDVGGPVVGPVVSTASGYVLPPGSLAQVCGETGHLVLLIHGFNVDRQRGRRTLLDLARALDGPVDAVFAAVLWPGDDRFSPFTFSFEERDADATAHGLVKWLDGFVPQSVRVSFVAHSLGCRVALSAMTGLERGGRAVSEVVLMAGAVDRDSLARSDRYRRAVDAARRVHWLASTSDRVLQFAYPAGDAIAAALFGGYTRTALGRRGPVAHGRETIPHKVDGLQVGYVGVGHGDYLPARPPNPKQVFATDYAKTALRG